MPSCPTNTSRAFQNTVQNMFKCFPLIDEKSWIRLHFIVSLQTYPGIFRVVKVTLVIFAIVLVTHLLPSRYFYSYLRCLTGSHKQTWLSSELSETSHVILELSRVGLEARSKLQPRDVARSGSSRADVLGSDLARRILIKLRLVRELLVSFPICNVQICISTRINVYCTLISCTFD